MDNTQLKIPFLCCKYALTFQAHGRLESKAFQPTFVG